MSKTVLLSAPARLPRSRATRVADWKLRGSFCEGWPIYHAIHDAGSGTIYAAAASEWHGERLARPDAQARRGSSRAKGSTTARTASSSLQGVRPDRHGRTLVGRRRDARRVRERDEQDVEAVEHARWPSGSRLERSEEPATWAPRRAGDAGASRRRGALLRDRAGHRHLRDADDGGVDALATRGCGPTGRSSTTTWGSACTSSSAHRRTATASTRTTWACTAQTTGAHLDGDHGGPPTSSACRRRPPARPRHLLRDPARSRPRARHAWGRRPSGAPATRARAGSGSTTACRSATSARCARAWRSTSMADPASTSARAPARCSRAPTRRELDRDRELSAGHRVGRGRRSGVAVADVHIPSTPPLFPGLPRCSSSRPRPSTSSTGWRSAGPASATASAPRATGFGSTSTSTSIRERAGLDTALQPGSRVDVITAISGG